MPHVLATLRTIAVTAVVTSAGWAAAGAVWLERMKPDPLRNGPAALMAAHDDPAPGAAAAARRPVAPAARLLIPVIGVTADQLVDTFTQAREDGARIHDAIDIPAPRSTPVIAAASGKVEKLYLSKPGGNTIYLRSPDGTLIYYYAHLDAYAPGLAEGQQVRAGDLLGTVGSTGNADPAAPHLHFAVMQTAPQAKWWEPATAINPYPLLGGR